MHRQCSFVPFYVEFVIKVDIVVLNIVFVIFIVKNSDLASGGCNGGFAFLPKCSLKSAMHMFEPSVDTHRM